MREGKQTQEVNKTNRVVVKANNCDDIDPNKPVSIAFYLSLNGPKRPLYTLHTTMHYEVQTKQVNTGKFANIGVSYMQTIFYALTE